jgi:hypothetical protein
MRGADELSHRDHKGYRDWFSFLCDLCVLCGSFGYDTTEIAQGMTEVLAYGTAVIVEVV